VQGVQGIPVRDRQDDASGAGSKGDDMKESGR